MPIKITRLLIFLAAFLVIPGSALASVVWNSAPSLPTAYVGMPYSHQLQATGDVPLVTYSIVRGNLLGLSLSSSGVISGTPSFRETTSVTIRATSTTFVIVAKVPVPVSETADRTFTLVVATGALSDLHIQRLQIYFENNRAEISLNKNDSAPRLFARLDYVGSGLLRGYWEVDGMVHSQVQQTLVYGVNLILEAAPVPPLPTYAGGSHRVRLVITEPVQDITLPVAIYYVTESKEKMFLPIALLKPLDRGSTAGEALFAWQQQNKTAAYLVEFFSQEEGSPIFSAYTRKTNYTISDHILSRIFADKGSYYWRVTGFSNDNLLNNQSKFQSFHFQKNTADGNQVP